MCELPVATFPPQNDMRVSNMPTSDTLSARCTPSTAYNDGATMQMSVPELVVKLVRQHVGISAINLFRPRISTPIQNNSRFSEAELRLIDGALALRDSTAFPFWDCLMQVTSTAEIEAENLLQIARRHNRQNVER